MTGSSDESKPTADLRWAAAREARLRGDAAGALFQFQAMAKDPHKYPGAFAAIASIYEFGGDGVLKDYDKAYGWYLKATELDDVEGWISLGRMYYCGTGVEQSFERALHYYRIGEDSQHPAALLMLGHMHRFGEGVESDIDTARNYYSRSAALGNLVAEQSLGELEMEYRPFWRGVVRYIKASLAIRRLLKTDRFDVRLQTG